MAEGGSERLHVLVIVNPQPRQLKKLLQRHRVLAVAIVIEVGEPRALGALARHYNARPLQLPPQLILEARGERGW